MLAARSPIAQYIWLEPPPNLSYRSTGTSSILDRTKRSQRDGIWGEIMRLVSEIAAPKPITSVTSTAKA